MNFKLEKLCMFLDILEKSAKHEATSIDKEYWKREKQKAREKVLKEFGATPEEIAFDKKMQEQDSTAGIPS